MNRQEAKRLGARIGRLAARVESARTGPQPFPYLPEIGETLHGLAALLESAPVDASRLAALARGMERLVTEDMDFARGSLGRRLLDLAGRCRIPPRE